MVMVRQGQVPCFAWWHIGLPLPAAGQKVLDLRLRRRTREMAAVGLSGRSSGRACTPVFPPHANGRGGRAAGAGGCPHVGKPSPRRCASTSFVPKGVDTRRPVVTAASARFGSETNAGGSRHQLWCGLDERHVLVNEGAIGLERSQCQIPLALQRCHDFGERDSMSSTKTVRRPLW